MVFEVIFLVPNFQYFLALGVVFFKIEVLWSRVRALSLGEGGSIRPVGRVEKRMSIVHDEFASIWHFFCVTPCFQAIWIFFSVY